MIWDLIQQHQIANTNIKLSSVDNKATTAESKVQGLIQRIERLELTNAAMWELLAERTALQTSDLVEKIREIDMRDGNTNGRMTPGIDCSACGRKFNRMHANCIYCGEAAR